MKRIALRLVWIVLVAGGLLGLQFFALNLQDSFQDLLLQAGVAIMLAVSLNIVNGFTGQFSIGHAGFMAVGAYAGGVVSYPLWSGVRAGIKAAHPGWSDAAVLQSFWSTSWWVIPAAMLMGGAVAALFGFAVGVPSLRLRGDYLAIVTLGFGEIIRVLLNNTEKLGLPAYLGGSLGFGICEQCTYLGVVKMPPTISFFVIFLAAALIIALTRNLKISLHGLAYQSIREDEIAADAMGVNTTRVKVAAFMLGAFFAGMAGALYGHSYQFQPSTFNFILSMNLVVMVVLGGTGSITGSAIAAVVLTAIPELLKIFKDKIPGFKDEYRLMIYALILVLMMIIRPQGVFGRAELSPGWLLRKFRKRKVEDGVPAAHGPAVATQPEFNGDILVVKGARKTFGGLTAVDDLNIELKKGELVGLIGPNGAGKTTVFNLLTGVYEPTDGSVNFLGRLIAGPRPYKPAHRILLLAMDLALAALGGRIFGIIVSTSIGAPVTWVFTALATAYALFTSPRRRRFKPGHRPADFAARGIARTFQNIRLFKDLSVIENVMLATYVRRRTNLFDALFRTGRMEREDSETRVRAHSLLARFELDGVADERASSLAYGDQRRLEIARALATNPKLLLLDEPAAGMNPQEKQELMEDILHIREEFGLTILLIEHDMKVVMGICERIYVLDYGEIIAHGTPEEIRKDPKVIAAYLGEEATA